MNTKNFDPYDFSKKEIYGVPVYYKNLPWAPCIHVRIVFNNGAFDDPIGKEGLSHFLEHMIFNGSPTLPDKKAIKEWSKIHALNTWNAWTNYNNTCFWFKCLPEEYSTVLSGARDMIFNSYLRPEDIEHERKVIIQEAWNAFKNDKMLKYNIDLVDNLFHGHDHARFATALGWPEIISKIKHEDVVLWHKKNYGIGNFFIVLTGAVENKHVQILENFLKDLPKVNKIIKNKETLGKPKQLRLVKTADEIGIVKEQVEISIVRIAERRPYQENEIGSLFGRLAYDLLYERLRTEHSICYGVDVEILRQNTFTKMSMNVETEEKYIELVENEFKNIINEIIDRKQIDRFIIIKKMYYDQFRSSEKFSGDIADSTVIEVSRYDGHVITQKEQLEQIERVEYEDIVKFAKWAFNPEYIYTEIILPSKKK